MKPSPSILLQVAALVLVSVLAAQSVAFGVLLLAPPPPPTPMTVAAVVGAFQAQPDQPLPPGLARRTSDRPPDPGRRGGAAVSALILLSLADALDASPESVRVSLVGRSATAPALEGGDASSFTVVRGRPSGVSGSGFRPPSPAMTAVVATLIRDGGVVLPPFRAAVRRFDGLWTVVEPREPLLSPARQRVLTAFALSLLALAPLVWWSARRLTRPIRLMAEAAERLGADPASPPLPASGPAEVREASRAFNRMREALLRHADQRAAMTAAIAHDLRTPLTSLRLRAELAPEPERGRMAEDIGRMDAMIAEALSLARGRHEEGERELCDLADLTAATVDDAVARGLDARTSHLEPAPVEADPDALRRALGNLVDNACRYGRLARVSVRVEAGHAAVTVEDAGSEPPPTDLERLFEPFVRGEPSRSRATGGAGLGLTSARQIARRHGGEVTLKARSPSGLTAVLTLPSAPNRR